MFKVKIISRIPNRLWLRYFKNPLQPNLNDCQFIFDPTSTDYDWLVVYEDFPSSRNNTPTSGIELLKCNPENTLLITTEPPNIKLYDPEYIHQFGHLLSSQQPIHVPHQHHIYSQPALLWYYGFDDKKELSWNELIKLNPKKSNVISTVTSNKQQKHSLHKLRFDFINELGNAFPEMDLFGKGIKPVANKAQAMDSYKYHVAVENYNGPHHWTEKLSDAFLSGCLPFYSGCPNITEYFPSESIIKIDIMNPKESINIIRQALDNNEYEKRLSAISVARKKVLYEYSFFNVISKIIKEKHSKNISANKNKVLLSRHATRKKYPLKTYPRVIRKELVQFFKRFS